MSNENKPTLNLVAVAVVGLMTGGGGTYLGNINGGQAAFDAANQRLIDLEQKVTGNSIELRVVNSEMLNFREVNTRLLALETSSIKTKMELDYRKNLIDELSRKVNSE